MLSASPLVLDASTLLAASELSALTSEDVFSFNSVDFSLSLSFSFSSSLLPPSLSADGEVSLSLSLFSSFFGGLGDFSPSSGISMIWEKRGDVRMRVGDQKKDKVRQAGVYERKVFKNTEKRNRKVKWKSETVNNKYLILLSGAFRLLLSVHLHLLLQIFYVIALGKVFCLVKRESD